MTDRPQPLVGPRLQRRTLAGAVTLGLGLPVLAACSGDTSSDVATDPNTTPASPPSSSSAGPTESATSQPSDSGGADALTSTSDIEVGGGTIFPDEQVVITQPAMGEFRCFTAVCTHQGCIVSSVSAADGTINCDCHGSAFSIEDGSVVNGPATSPLDQEQITVDGDAITLA